MISQCNIAVLGDGSVGKSSIVASFRSDSFGKIYKQTVGFDTCTKRLTIKGTECSLSVFDIGGQSIRSLNLPAYIGSAEAVFLCYDVTNAESFRNLEDWLLLIRKHAPKKASIHLVGNKVDMIGQRQVESTQHDVFIRENGLSGGAFTSAKSGENVVKMFYKVAALKCGVKLTDSDLLEYDKVLKAHISSEEDEGDRTTFADEIEAEDRAMEQRKLQRESGGCAATCLLL